MRVIEGCFSPPVPPQTELETQSSQRENTFSFLVRGQKRKDLHCDASQDNSWAYNNVNLDKMVVLPKGMLLFVFLPLKGKQIKN